MTDFNIWTQKTLQGKTVIFFFCLSYIFFICKHLRNSFYHQLMWRSGSYQKRGGALHIGKNLDVLLHVIKKILALKIMATHTDLSLMSVTFDPNHSQIGSGDHPHTQSGSGDL